MSAQSRQPSPPGRGAPTSPSDSKVTIFGIWFVVLLVMIAVPPVYLAASHADPWILGLPFSVAYMLIHGLLCVALVAVLFAIESGRGELEMFVEDDEDAAGSPS